MHHEVIDAASLLEAALVVEVQFAGNNGDVIDIVGCGKKTRKFTEIAVKAP